MIVNLTSGTVSSGHAQGDILLGFENVIGSAHNVTLTGSTGNNILVSEGVWKCRKGGTE